MDAILARALAAAAVPALLVGAAAAVSRARAPRRDALLGALAVAGALFAAQALLKRTPPLPGTRVLSAQEWLVWALVATVPIAPLAAAPRRSTVCAALAVIAAAATLAATSAKLRVSWHGLDAAARASLALVLTLLVVGASWRSATRRPGPRAAFTLGGAGLALAIAAPLSGTVFLGQLAGAITAGLGAAFLVALVARPRALAPAALAVAAAGLSAIGICALLYDDLSPWVAALLAATPLAGLALDGQAREGSERSGPPWFARATLALLPALAAVVLAWLLHEPDPYS